MEDGFKSGNIGGRKTRTEIVTRIQVKWGQTGAVRVRTKYIEWSEEQKGDKFSIIGR